MIEFLFGCLITAVVWGVAHALGLWAARAHDRKYFPPAVLLRGKDDSK